MTDLQTIETPYGTAIIGEDWCSVTAHLGQLHDWATRPRESWPCSVLYGDIDSVTAGFDTNGLFDLTVLPAEPEDLTGDELNAWTSDVLAIALTPDHPCWLVCVGQFHEAGYAGEEAS